MPSTIFSSNLLIVPVRFESRHRPTQLVGLSGRKPGRRDCDLHGLFLEQGNTQRSFQNQLQFLARIVEVSPRDQPPAA